MTEAEWLACTDAQKMLECLRGKASDRKLRLFISACYRRVWQFELDGPTRRAVEAVEFQAEALLTGRKPAPVIDDLKASERHAALRMRCFAGEPYVNAIRHFAVAKTGLCGLASFAAEEAVGTAVTSTYKSAAKIIAPTAGEPAMEIGDSRANEIERALQEAQNAESGVQADLLREVFGPLPFRTTSLAPAILNWHGGLLVSMARRMYEARDFMDMPVLADGLEEAGCSNPDILSHCRSGGEHIRGCWAIDLILGRS